MAVFRTRRRVARPLRAVTWLAAVALLGGVAFAVPAFAEEDGTPAAGPVAALPVAGQAAQPADKKSDEKKKKSDEKKKAEKKKAEQALADEQEPPVDEPPSDQSSSDQPPSDEPPTDEPPADEPVAEPGLPENIVAGTPCTNSTVACVSLGAKKAWLFEDGKIVRGPVSISTGGPGKETPVGDFVVEWKHKDHKSSEFFKPHGCTPGKPGCEGAPMNFAVFFAEGGIAFHEGQLNQRSSGCVRLTRAEAEFYYNFLNLGDRVEVRG